MPTLYVSKNKTKKLGYVSLVTFAVCLLLFVTLIFIFNNSYSSMSTGATNLLGIFMTAIFFGGLIALLTAGLTLGNLLVKIVFALPLTFILIFLVIYLFFFRPHKVNGVSMMPGIKNGDFILANVLHYKTTKPKRGDVVIFKRPIPDDSTYIARVAGLPGEYISILKGKIYINNRELNEPYLADGTETTTGDAITAQNTLIPNGEYAILGDNRNHSLDSRAYGFVKEEDITQLVFYIYWPSADRGTVK